MKFITPDKHARDKGFTLLEVLVALVISAAATSLVLSHLRTLIDLDRRIRQHQHLVSGLLNDTAKFSALDFASLRTDIHKDYLDLLIIYPKRTIARVHNFSQNAQKVPPVDQAYTPYQTFTIDPQGRYSLQLLLPGLKSPASS